MERSTGGGNVGVDVDGTDVGVGVGGIGLGVDSAHFVMNRHEVKKRSAMIESRKIFFI